jgi:hypothetical protein
MRLVWTRYRRGKNLIEKNVACVGVIPAIVVIPCAASGGDQIDTTRLRIYIGRRFAVRDFVQCNQMLCWIAKERSIILLGSALGVDVSSLKYVERLIVWIVIKIPKQDEPLVFVVPVKFLWRPRPQSLTSRARWLVLG